MRGKEGCALTSPSVLLVDVVQLVGSDDFGEPYDVGVPRVRLFSNGRRQHTPHRHANKATAAHDRTMMAALRPVLPAHETLPCTNAGGGMLLPANICKTSALVRCNHWSSSGDIDFHGKTFPGEVVMAR